MKKAPPGHSSGCGAVELLVGEESERRGKKVVVRHGVLKAAETPILFVSHRHCASASPTVQLRS